MKVKFQEILEIEKTLGVMFFSFKGEILFEEYTSATIQIMAPDADWPRIIQSLENACEADLMYESIRIYFRETNTGYLLVIMEPDAPAAMVRLNCYTILPTLRARNTKTGRMKESSNRFNIPSSLRYLKNPHDLFILFSSTMTVLAGATLAPALPGMKAAFSHVENAEFWVKMILSVPGLAIVVVAPFLGYLTDRKNNYSILCLSLLVYGLAGTSGYVFDHSIAAIFFGRVILGIAVAGVMVSVVTIAGSKFQGPAFSSFMGIQAAFSSFGGVVFLALGGFLAEITWQVPFLIYTIALFILPGVWLNCNSSLNTTGKHGHPKEPTGLNRWHLLCYFLGFAEVLILYLIPLHLPFFLQQFEDVSTITIGSSIAGMLCVTAFVSIYYSRYGNKLRVSQMHSIGFLLVALGFVNLGWASNFYIAALGLSMMGIGFGIVRPNLIVWLFSITNLQSQGRIMGGLTTSYFLAQFLAPLLTQPLVNFHGLKVTFLVAAFFCVFLCLGLYALQAAETKELLPNSISRL